MPAAAVPHHQQLTPQKVAYSIIYVLPLYGSDATRPSPTRSRDDPAAIRARVRAVTLSTTACSLFTFLFLWYLPQQKPALYVMGYWPVRLAESARALLLTATLFAGPLYESLIIDGGWRYVGSRPLDIWNSWPDWRNIIAVSGPAAAHHQHLAFITACSLNELTTGACHRRMSLSLCRSPTLAPSPGQPFQHHIFVTFSFRGCPYSPLLRVPPDATRRVSIRRSGQDRHPAGIHISIRSVCYLFIPQNRIPACCHPRSRLLQLSWSPTSLGIYGALLATSHDE